MAAPAPGLELGMAILGLGISGGRIPSDPVGNGVGVRSWDRDQFGIGLIL